MELPKHGTAPDDVLAQMREAGGGDANWRAGRTFSLVYYAGDELLGLLKSAYTMYMSENALGPHAFPSLRRFEADVVGWAASLLGGGETAAGSMTSGGTESILMAVKTARDRARAERGVTAPEMVVPITVHPAFEKAAHYLGVRAVHAPIRDDYRVDVNAARGMINEHTVLIVGSAPCYPYGVVDPIEELAALAAERGIGCHVDACLGGFLLPFVRDLGYDLPRFDFAVPGVTSMSADLHKYGFAAKGASVVLYRDKEIRRHQFFTYRDWPGGVYASPTMAGTRPGGAIAAAWAVMRYLGHDGYMRIARTIMDTTRRLVDGINAIDGLTVRGKPQMSVFAFGSDTLDPYAIGDALEARDWHPDRLQLPPDLHLMITPAHEDVVDEFLADLRAATDGAAGRTGAARAYSSAE